MLITDIEDLLTSYQYMRLTEHALNEAHKESLRAKDIFYAIFNGQILEHYPRRRRVLIVGPTPGFDVQVHVVCDYADREEIVAVTVYIPDRPTWISDHTRAPSPLDTVD